MEKENNGLYFRSPNLFEGQLCKADTSAGIRFFKYFAIDLLEHGAKVDTSKTADDLLLNFSE